MSKRISGCGAVGSALPWGGRGRWFKSSHSDQQAVPAPKIGCSRCLLFICFTTVKSVMSTQTNKKPLKTLCIMGFKRFFVLQISSRFFVFFEKMRSSFVYGRD